MIRPRRVWAVAQRDLRMQLKGRRSWLLPAVAAFLLLPISALPRAGEIDREAIRQVRMPEVPVAGDVPPEVAALKDVRVVRPDQNHAIYFERTKTGQYRVISNVIPIPIRNALDGKAPSAPTIHDAQKDPPIPGRTLPLAMIAASITAGSLSESIGGERQQKTLQNLLAAAISRWELVLGKWLAWAGFGMMSGGLAAVAAIVAGRVDLGWWILPFPTVAMATVAMGMFLVRRAADVVGGATISLRTIPAVLTMVGLGAWYLGFERPLLGAAIPLGGALVAAGNTWPGAGPALVSTVSSLLFTWACLYATSRDLEQLAPPSIVETRRFRLAAGTAALAAIAYQGVHAGPLLWAMAGNRGLMESLPREPAALAAGLALGAMTAIRVARAPGHTSGVGFTRAPPLAWGAAVVVAVMLALSGSIAELTVYGDTWVGEARMRMAHGMNPVWAGGLIWALCVLGEETVFRGWLRHTAGPVLSVLAYVAVFSPFDPLLGLTVGGGLVGLTMLAGGSILPALLARGLWAIAVPFVPAIPPLAALALAVVVVGGLAGLSRQQTT